MKLFIGVAQLVMCASWLIAAGNKPPPPDAVMTIGLFTTYFGVTGTALVVSGIYDL